MFSYLLERLFFGEQLQMCVTIVLTKVNVVCSDMNHYLTAVYKGTAQFSDGFLVVISLATIISNYCRKRMTVYQSLVGPVSFVKQNKGY